MIIHNEQCKDFLLISLKPALSSILVPCNEVAKHSQKLHYSENVFLISGLKKA